MLNQNIFGFTTKNKRSIKPLNYQVDLTKLEATSQIFIQENMKKTILFGGSSLWLGCIPWLCGELSLNCDGQERSSLLKNMFILKNMCGYENMYICIYIYMVFVYIYIRYIYIYSHHLLRPQQTVAWFEKNNKTRRGLGFSGCF